MNDNKSDAALRFGLRRQVAPSAKVPIGVAPLQRTAQRHEQGFGEPYSGLYRENYRPYMRTADAALTGRRMQQRFTSL